MARPTSPKSYDTHSISSPLTKIIIVEKNLQNCPPSAVLVGRPIILLWKEQQKSSTAKITSLRLASSSFVRSIFLPCVTDRSIMTISAVGVCTTGSRGLARSSQPPKQQPDMVWPWRRRLKSEPKAQAMWQQFCCNDRKRDKIGNSKKKMCAKLGEASKK